MKIITLSITLLLSLYAICQSSIKGRVLDEQNRPIYGVRVYIGEQQHGTRTDYTGNYELANVKEGTWEVTYRMLGYETQTETLSFTQDGTILYTAILKEDLSSLDEVIVSASRNSEYLSEIPASVTVVNEIKLREFSN